MDESLQSILDNETSPVAPEPVAEVKDEKPAAEVKTEEVAATPSVAQEPEKVQQDDKPTNRPLTAQEHAALVALKLKTKELERQLAEAKSGQPKEEPDFWADPEKAVQEQVQKAVIPLKERLFKQSISSAAEKHTDFEQAAERFEQMVSENPSLQQQLRESDDPGEFIYQTASKTPEVMEKQVGTLKSQMAEMEKKLAALAAENESLKKGQAAVAAVPPSLNAIPSAAAPKAADVDDDDISTIVRFKTG